MQTELFGEEEASWYLASCPSRAAAISKLQTSGTATPENKASSAA